MNQQPEVAVAVTTAGSRLAVSARMANRHGLIAGATGTGKTVTLQVLAEGFSSLGVPVFAADVKGDLSGIAALGDPTRVQDRLTKLQLANFESRSFPAVFWDVFGKRGHAVRTTVSDMGPLMFARLLGLNATQGAVLEMAFHISDQEGLLLLDLKDLREVLAWMGEHAADLKERFGSFSPASLGAIQRGLMNLENSGGNIFFGEPALSVTDLMQCDQAGRGTVNLFDAAWLIENPRLYTTFLLWLLSELFEELPEVGDLPKPRLVFFFDEAHLLFKDGDEALLAKIEQVVRLVRSKGVGVYFVTQNPLDIPASVLGQLGNRVQHALRAFTPADQKAVKAAAQTFRANSGLRVEEAITELATGEALVSFLDQQGAPAPVERAFIVPPASRIGPLTDAERSALFAQSRLAGRYDRSVDRESAFELLRKRRSRAQEQPEARPERPAAKPKAPQSRRQSSGEAFLKSTLRSIGASLGREIVRGILGSMRGR